MPDPTQVKGKKGLYRATPSLRAHTAACAHLYSHHITQTYHLNVQTESKSSGCSTRGRGTGRSCRPRGFSSGWWNILEINVVMVAQHSTDWGPARWLSRCECLRLNLCTTPGDHPLELKLSSGPHGSAIIHRPIPHNK